MRIEGTAREIRSGHEGIDAGIFVSRRPKYLSCSFANAFPDLGIVERFSTFGNSDWHHIFTVGPLYDAAPTFELVDKRLIHVEQHGFAKMTFQKDVPFVFLSGAISR